VKLETDCLQLVQLWNKKDAQCSIVDLLLQEIDVLRLAFQGFSFSYISRICNKVPHTLAKQVSKSHRSETWHITPTCLYNLISSEASVGW